MAASKESHQAAEHGGSDGGGRLVQIDGLRAIAVLVVLAFHYTARYDYWYLHTLPLPLQLSDGILGVCLFFAISGFVIHMTIDRCKAPLDFVVSRFSRLYPTYWVAVAVTWLLVFAFGLPGHEVSGWHALVNFTMLQSFFSVPDVDGVYWSLEVELMFYAWMLVLWVAGALRYPVAVFAGWVGLALVVAVAGHALHVPWVGNYMLLLDWIPWFAIGLMAYVTLRDGAIRPRHLAVLALAVVAIAARMGALAGGAAVAVAFALFGASRGRFPPLVQPVLVFIGAISYPLYLVHENIGWLIILSAENVGAHPGLSIALAVTGCIALAAALHYGIEMRATSAIRARYRSWRETRPKTAFRRRAWAVGTVSSLAVLGLAIVVTTRLGAHPPERHGALTGVHQPSGTEPPCQATTAARGLLVVLGQSNAASHAASDRASPPVRLLQASGCVLAVDPLPGTTGDGASVWSAMIERLDKDPDTQQFVLAPLAVESSRMADWVGYGFLRPHLEKQLKQVRESGIPVRAVLMEIGESDSMHGTAASLFRDDLLALRALLDKNGIRAPLVMARSTYCQGHDAPALGRALDAAAAHSPRILVGPDTDDLRDGSRIGVCHFSSAGRDEAARRWAIVVRKLATP